MKKAGSQTGEGKPKTGKGKAGKSKAAKTKTPEGRDADAALRRELQSLLSDIDEEGLRFLIDQARILRYNAEVDRMNQELAEKRTRLRAELGAEKPSSTPSKAASPVRQAVLIEDGFAVGSDSVIVSVRGE